MSFRREGPVVDGGPNGGDGGNGGDVWLVADHNVASLLPFRDHPHRRATNGVHGKGKDLHGKRGTTLEVKVPEGTVVKDLYTNEVLAELFRHGDRWLGAAGGRGGRGNARFLSNKRRAPTFAEQGEHGDERWLKLELQLMADVALVGFPNAGKSTLISVISAAKPKIANYPFTTLEPNLGVVALDDDTNFVVADIPGLIEGASEGRGLGHRFLRHVERARVLCLLIDLVPMDEMSAQQQEETLLNELGQYRPDLLSAAHRGWNKSGYGLDRNCGELWRPLSDFIDHPLRGERTRWTNGISCSRISLGRTTSRGGCRDAARGHGGGSGEAR